MGAIFLHFVSGVLHFYGRVVSNVSEREHANVYAASMDKWLQLGTERI
jgi:hypothetical protein